MKLRLRESGACLSLFHKVEARRKGVWNVIKTMPESSVGRRRHASMGFPSSGFSGNKIRPKYARNLMHILCLSQSRHFEMARLCFRFSLSILFLPFISLSPFPFSLYTDDAKSCHRSFRGQKKFFGARLSHSTAFGWKHLGNSFLRPFFE